MTTANLARSTVVRLPSARLHTAIAIRAEPRSATPPTEVVPIGWTGISLDKVGSSAVAGIPPLDCLGTRAAAHCCSTTQILGRLAGARADLAR